MVRLVETTDMWWPRTKQMGKDSCCTWTIRRDRLEDESVPIVDTVLTLKCYRLHLILYFLLITIKTKHSAKSSLAMQGTAWRGSCSWNWAIRVWTSMHANVCSGHKACLYNKVHIFVILLWGLFTLLRLMTPWSSETAQVQETRVCLMT